MSFGKEAQATAATSAGNASTEFAGVPDDLIELGRVLGAHGIKGWIKVQPFSSDSGALGATKRWWLCAPVSPLQASKTSSTIPSKPLAATPFDLLWAKPHGANWIACVKGLNDRDQAQALKGQTVLVPRASFPKLDDGEYYWVDLIGCSVLTELDGGVDYLGVVESVQDSPAHPILMVRQQRLVNDQPTDCVDDKGKPIYSLIPFVQAHVGDIDLKARSIKTNWPRDF